MWSQEGGGRHIYTHANAKIYENGRGTPTQKIWNRNKILYSLACPDIRRRSGRAGVSYRQRQRRETWLEGGVYNVAAARAQSGSSYVVDPLRKHRSIDRSVNQINRISISKKHLILTQPLCNTDKFTCFFLLHLLCSCLRIFFYKIIRVFRICTYLQAVRARVRLAWGKLAGQLTKQPNSRAELTFPANNNFCKQNNLKSERRSKRARECVRVLQLEARLADSCATAIATNAN